MVAPKLGPEHYVALENRIDVSATTLGSKDRIFSAGSMWGAVELGPQVPCHELTFPSSLGLEFVVCQKVVNAGKQQSIGEKQTYSAYSA